MLLTIYKLKNHYLQIEKSKQQEIFRCIENNCFLGSERSFSIRLQHWKYDLGDSTTRFSPHGNGSLDPRKNHDMILWKQKIHRHLRILMASRVNYDLYPQIMWNSHIHIIYNVSVWVYFLYGFKTFQYPPLFAPMRTIMPILCKTPSCVFTVRDVFHICIAMSSAVLRGSDIWYYYVKYRLACLAYRFANGL